MFKKETLSNVSGRLNRAALREEGAGEAAGPCHDTDCCR